MATKLYGMKPCWPVVSDSARYHSGSSLGGRRGSNYIVCGFIYVRMSLPVKESLLVDDFELLSLLKAQVVVVGGLIAVYGHHKVVCKRSVGRFR